MKPPAKYQKRPSVSQTYDLHRSSVISVMPNDDVPNTGRLNADEAALVALGYKQEFKREFSLWTTFCVSFAVLGLLPSFASTLYYGMGYAGTGGKFSTLPSWILRLYANLCNLRHGLGLD